ncbi:LOW QUALITY PROTEIN: hypothetical protein Dda_1773 [Drechslerella dactyloides]|uniref:Transmembrane protein n=1 Tax=Drechslerella dactyloides TaxID=74499 RepID=A0AAD6NM33_DREDA|nr:LOW QUALITY PROTEIN: hypothetical protein Dda_1773 [Drechslerella dactyloides]
MCDLKEATGGKRYPKKKRASANKKEERKRGWHLVTISRLDQSVRMVMMMVVMVVVIVVKGEVINIKA